MMSFPRSKNYELQITNGNSSSVIARKERPKQSPVQRNKFASCYLLLATCYLLLYSCTDTFTPKPKSYFRISLPEKSYRPYTSDVCPFSFEYPAYATIERDSVFLGEPAENPCWMNIDFKGLGGEIYISYKEINENNTLDKLIDDAHKLTFKHTTKADYIDENTLQNKNGVSGMMFEVGGNAASSAQFFLTDSTRHFIRGSLYFNTAPNEDSLAPVIRFVKQDMLRMIETFRWVN